MVVHLDRTLSQSLDARERYRVSSWEKRLKGKTHLSDRELLCLLLMFQKLTSPNRRYLEQREFFYVLRVQFEIHDRSMLSRIFSIVERPHEPGVGHEEWIRLLDVYLRGTLDEKIRFNWRVYDNTGKGVLEEDDIIGLTWNHLGPHATDEERNEFTDDVLALLDTDSDGAVSYEDFRTAISSHPTELNTLGTACPEPQVVAAFLATFTP